MTEAVLQRAVIELAQVIGWKAMHQLPAMTKKGWATTTQGDGRGFPDLILVRERIMFVELKVDGRYLNAFQRMWRDWILAAGGEWYCWKPAQWRDGTIEDILRSELRDETSEIIDPDRFARLLKACSGDERQARRVYSSIALLTRTAPPQ